MKENGSHFVFIRKIVGPKLAKRFPSLVSLITRPVHVATITLLSSTAHCSCRTVAVLYVDSFTAITMSLQVTEDHPLLVSSNGKTTLTILDTKPIDTIRIGNVHYQNP